jgi:HlyD family secretion protein
MVGPAWRRFLAVVAWLSAATAVLLLARAKLLAPAEVRVTHPQRGSLVEEVFGTGTLESKVVVGVSSKIVGRVVEVLVDQGDTVAAGQTLARLEANDFKDAVGVAVAQPTGCEIGRRPVS